MTVTTADGTEYKFDGLMEQWHTHLVTALTARGREVRATPAGLAVTPRALGGAG